eukprot:TRINITY_DN2547_c4_g1_i1.p1 TRINITY_DN2547_c4_g1~~TRINITY_DN2547_c4_g1_i1.p1  ORF type:complete len:853 (+),score=208.00 TRINITY_DN2547_c4_g1_i1:66-2561(+)
MPPKAKKAAAKKAGPSSAALAALKARREKELELERIRKEEEEAEELRLKEEEEKRLADEKAKEERAKQRQEAKGNEPKGLSGKEREQKEKNLKKLEQMRKSGMQIPEAMLRKLMGDDSSSTATDSTTASKKEKTETLAQKKKRIREEKAAAEKAEKEKEQAEAAKKEEGSGDWEDEASDDWEAEADKEEAKADELESQESSFVVVSNPADTATEETESVSTTAPSTTHTDPEGEDLRSPICCVLGHVDTGKTKLLDYIRRTNVQHGEAGGITQQIGASFFPVESILQKTKSLNAMLKKQLQIKVPGLLVIDTPGHESFTNLRSRGSALCDISILVVDIMHGLEPQTKESIRLLKQRKCPFVVALNKIDRLYDWKANKDAPFDVTFKKQKDYVRAEFDKRIQAVQLELSEQGLNAMLYTRNKDFLRNVSLVPTSAHTGEGIPDLLLLMVQLTQRHMSQKLTYTDELHCTVLEVKKVEGHGITIDVILVNGTLKEGDTILVCGMNGPIVTQVRALLTPQPLKELRVKAEYVHHKSIKAAQGIKISAHNLEDAVPGTAMYVLREGDDIEKLREEVMSELGTMVSRTQSDMGVCVQASTLGALEALLSFLKDSKIPVSTVGVGTVHKKDIMRVIGIKEKNPKYAVMLCFDVTISPEAQEIADKEEIKIFTADIIYHLQDKFTQYLKDFAEAARMRDQNSAVFPCVLEIIKGNVFNKKDPIILGMKVVKGQLRPGTPLFVWKTKEDSKKKYPFHVGKVESAEVEHRPQKVVKAGLSAAVKIKAEGITFGRQIEEKDVFYSEITRESLDALKESFREEMDKSDWQLCIELKKMLGIL